MLRFGASGLVPRVLDTLFVETGAASRRGAGMLDVEVRVSFVELYGASSDDSFGPPDDTLDDTFDGIVG